MKFNMRSAVPGEVSEAGESVLTQAASISVSRSACIVFFLLMVLCSVWFYALAARTIVPTDEARYAQIASEMATSGDFVTMRLNGIKYFGKPPLQAWMSALAFRLFGFGEWQARLWTSLCGLVGIFAVFHAGRRVFSERAGFISALVLGSSLYWVAGGHVSSYDMSLSAMMALALSALLLAQRNGAAVREQRNWMLVCWAGMALAVMSKGLVGIVLPGAVLVLYTLSSRDWSIWKRLHIGKGLLLFLLITTPWFTLVSIENPEFPYFFFVREHFQRFASNVHLREKPFYYFVPFLVLGVMPWFGVIAQSLRNGARRTNAGFQAGRLLLIWAAFIFVFFSVSKAKLPSYIMPIFPAIALLVGHYLVGATHRAIEVAARWFGALGVLLIALVIALLAAGPALIKEAHTLALCRAYIPWASGGAVVALVGSIVAAWMSRRHEDWALASLAAAGFLCGQLLIIGHETFGRHKAGVAHLPAIQAELTPQTSLYSVGQYEYSMPFYLHRTLTMVDRAEDGMRLGLEREPGLWLPRIDDFINVWKAHQASGRNAIAFMRPDIHANLQQLGLPMRVIAHDNQRVIVSSNLRDQN